MIAVAAHLSAGRQVDFSTNAVVRSFARSWTLGYLKVTLALGQTEAAKQHVRSRSIAGIPMGPSGTPDELAKAVPFRPPDYSSVVTGNALFLDGGAARIKLTLIANIRRTQ
jgi:NAD(P)-dependent dehydrogenase (short-subunit alcohol dehydrogenase family)